jgi:hypothetical protein
MERRGCVRAEEEWKTFWISAGVLGTGRMQRTEVIGGSAARAQVSTSPILFQIMPQSSHGIRVPDVRSLKMLGVGVELRMFAAPFYLQHNDDDHDNLQGSVCGAQSHPFHMLFASHFL